MSLSKADTESDIQTVSKIFFRIEEHKIKKGKWIVTNDADGNAFCLRCEDWIRDNSGHSNLFRHVQTNHKDWQEKLDEQRSGKIAGGGMDKYLKITKRVSDEAKNMYGLLEWIVMADLPLKSVENEYFQKRSNLKPTTYKTVSKHMEKVLSLVKEHIKESMPDTFGLIFDGWSCDSEHYIAIFATWVLPNGKVVKVK